ncbi:MAG: hypothetical protein JO120_09060 [Solirubrobacterales bacterium]|nr:hypothetical protein [Solirubrobacterales bacterium]
MPVGQPVLVAVPLQSTAYAIPSGHRIRLAVSNTYWPMAWPSPEPSTLTVHCGPRSVLSLPRRRPSPLDTHLRPFAAPETGTALESEPTMVRKGGRRLRRDLATREVELEFDWRPTGTRIVATGTELREENVTRYRIVEGEPLSAGVFCDVDVSLARPGWNVRTRATSTMTSDAERFVVTSTLEAFEGTARVHARTWTHRFPRDGT